MLTINGVVEYHAVLDIETLSTDSNAFITSIALQLFYPIRTTNDWENLPCLTLELDPWVEQKGAVIDQATIIWRQRQDEVTKADLRLSPQEYYTLPNALDMVRKMLDDYKVKRVWARGPDFDCVIVNNAAKREFGKPIIPYYICGDHRTLQWLYETATQEKYKLGNSHIAIDDCRNQVDLIQQTYQYIKGTEWTIPPQEQTS